MINIVIRFILSVLVAALFITTAATQLVLYNLTSFDVPAVSFATRVSSTWQDLINFGPTVLIIVSASYLIGFIIAWLLSKLCLTNKLWGYVAGLTSVPTAVLLVNSITGIDVIYITSHSSGWLILVLGSVLGSMLFVSNTAAKEVNK